MRHIYAKSVHVLACQICCGDKKTKQSRRKLDVSSRLLCRQSTQLWPKIVSPDCRAYLHGSEVIVRTRFRLWQEFNNCRTLLYQVLSLCRQVLTSCLLVPSFFPSFFLYKQKLSIISVWSRTWAVLSHCWVCQPATVAIELTRGEFNPCSNRPHWACVTELRTALWELGVQLLAKSETDCKQKERLNLFGVGCCLPEPTWGANLLPDLPRPWRYTPLHNWSKFACMCVCGCVCVGVFGWNSLLPYNFVRLFFAF